MIEKLKKAGLGYNISESETKDKFGMSYYIKKIFTFFCKIRTQFYSPTLCPL